MPGKMSSDEGSAVHTENTSASPSLQANHVKENVNEAAFVRKLDRRILPIACLMYLFACTSNHLLGVHPVELIRV